jgi:hypothetical protein
MRVVDGDSFGAETISIANSNKTALAHRIFHAQTRSRLLRDSGRPDPSYNVLIGRMSFISAWIVRISKYGGAQTIGGVVVAAQVFPSTDKAGGQQDASVARRKGYRDEARGCVGACGDEQGRTRRVKRVQSEESECASRVGGVALALILA